jgi:hypothetical protein
MHELVAFHALLGKQGFIFPPENYHTPEFYTSLSIACYLCDLNVSLRNKN